MFGLFDFAVDMGKKLFSSDENPTEKIKSFILSDNPGVDPLSVDFTDGVVSLSGKASSHAALEKAVLMAGNVQGVVTVNADNLAAPEAESKAEYYVIKSGDSLSKIAKQFYGNAMDYPKIYEANKEVIKDADLIYPGQKIRIPMA